MNINYEYWIGIISTNGGVYVSDPITNKLSIELDNNKNIKVLEGIDEI